MYGKVWQSKAKYDKVEKVRKSEESKTFEKKVWKKTCNN